MTEAQPTSIVEGATTGDVDDEIPTAAKSAEDRKAAAALSSLDAPRDDDSGTKDVDQEAVRQAMDRLAVGGATNGVTTKKAGEKKEVKKTVKVDPADVTFIVGHPVLISTSYQANQCPKKQIEELELPKVKATDLLRAHEGDAIKALRAYITPSA
ncbi:hypothetical protein PVAG01_02686 [Phlyctema vagabunda]|uniref:Nascent polypeptide-associated complex subunit alpha-like UBA domain-containing protein n=1 Tax=Phlyctema vagabunda TaxID=108571 RepID=A0ABR4PRD6_9HELO